MVKREPGSDIVAWRLHLRGLAVTVVGVVVAALTLLGMTSAAAVAATGSCEIQPETSRTDSPYLGEIERLIQTQAAESKPHGEEAVPEDDVGTEVEKELGSQYGGEWYEVEAGDFAVGLVTGPISIQQATEKVYEILTRMIEPQALAFAEAHVRVLSVPYSPAELTAAAASIWRELEESGVSKGASVGETVGEVGEPLSPGNWPQISVIFDGNATQAECEAAIPVLAKYGTDVRYSRREGVPVAEVGPLPTPAPLGASKEPSKSPTARNAPSRPTIANARNGTDALRAVMRRLKHQSRQGFAPIKARIKLAVPTAGRLLVRIWATSGRTRKLVAVGVTPVHAGDGEIVTVMDRTAFGRHLDGTGRYRMVGEVRLLSAHRDVTLATEISR